MKIIIDYKIRTLGTIRTIELTKDEYFDGEIARFGDNIDYVSRRDKGLRKSDLEFTQLTITESDDDKIQRETYFADENELRYHKDSTGWELIVQQVQVSEDCVVITRMERDNGAAEWKNISYSTILNFATKDEQVLRSHKGEYVTTPIKNV